MSHVNIHNGLSMRIHQRNNPRLLRFLVLSLDNNNKKEKKEKKVVKASYYDLFVMFQNDVPLGGREHYSSLELEKAFSLFTCESCCCFVENGTFLQLKLFYCWS